MVDAMRSERGRVLRGRVVYISARVVLLALRIVFFLPTSVVCFVLHGRFRPARRRLPQPVRVLLLNAKTLAYIAGSGEITPAHLQAALDAGSELLPRCGFGGIRFSTDAASLWKRAVTAAGGLNAAAIDHLRDALASP